VVGHKLCRMSPDMGEQSCRFWVQESRATEDWGSKVSVMCVRADGVTMLCQLIVQHGRHQVGMWVLSDMCGSYACAAWCLSRRGAAKQQYWWHLEVNCVDSVHVV
jgi:hypothetical protein